MTTNPPQALQPGDRPPGFPKRWAGGAAPRGDICSSPLVLSSQASTMTKALKKAFEVASRLPEREQDELATAILEELAADERWEATLAQSQGALERLADEALAEHRAGRTKALDPDAL